MNIFLGCLIVFSLMIFIIMPEYHSSIFNEKTNERIINFFLRIFTPFDSSNERNHYRRVIRQRLDNISFKSYNHPVTVETLDALRSSKQTLHSIDMKEVKSQCKKTHYVLARELPKYIKNINHEIEVVQKHIRAYDDPFDFVNTSFNLRK